MGAVRRVVVVVRGAAAGLDSSDAMAFAVAAIDGSRRGTRRPAAGGVIGGHDNAWLGADAVGLALVALAEWPGRDAHRAATGDRAAGAAERSRCGASQGAERDIGAAAEEAPAGGRSR